MMMKKQPKQLVLDERLASASSLFFRAFGLLARVMPSSLIGRVVLVLFLPAFLLLTTLWAIFLQPSPLTPYLAGLLLFGSVMACQYRTKGLLISYAALIGAYLFKQTSFSLYEVGLCVAAATDFLILLLGVDEVKSLLSTLVAESKSYMNQYLVKNQELLANEESWSEARQALEEEIAEWKEEAKQRKIDLQMSVEKMELVQSEIEMLTSQKERILQEAYALRKTVPERSTQIEGLYKQLRIQFEEKSRALVQTRKELFQAQTKLQGQEIEQRLAEFDGEREEVNHLEEELAHTLNECAAMEEEINALEALISHILAQ